MGGHDAADVRFLDGRLERGQVNFAEHAVGGFEVLAVLAGERFAIGSKVTGAAALPTNPAKLWIEKARPTRSAGISAERIE